MSAFSGGGNVSNIFEKAKPVINASKFATNTHTASTSLPPTWVTDQRVTQGTPHGQQRTPQGLFQVRRRQFQGILPGRAGFRAKMPHNSNSVFERTYPSESNDTGAHQDKAQFSTTQTWTTPPVANRFQGMKRKAPFATPPTEELIQQDSETFANERPFSGPQNNSLSQPLPSYVHAQRNPRPQLHPVRPQAPRPSMQRKWLRQPQASFDNTVKPVNVPFVLRALSKDSNPFGTPQSAEVPFSKMTTELPTQHIETKNKVNITPENDTAPPILETTLDSTENDISPRENSQEELIEQNSSLEGQGEEEDVALEDEESSGSDELEDIEQLEPDAIEEQAVENPLEDKPAENSGGQVQEPEVTELDLNQPEVLPEYVEPVFLKLIFVLTFI